MKPDDLWIIYPTPTPTMTLFACHPKHSAAERIVVKGKLVHSQRRLPRPTRRHRVTRPIALVTGASSGIGEAFARLLAERGHDLVLVARDEGRLEAAREGARRTRTARSAQVLPADLTDARPAPASSRTVAATRDAPIDVLVNNAGFGSFGAFHTLDLDGEIREIQLNVVALVRLTHAAASQMVPRGRGGILNVSSLAGSNPDR